ncbi:putative late blight resistance protein homolog R1B-14 isoform X1 [Olea europaea var. sylvestris]|nr:putative late blight resistance protein homolog R1B-14 isoform X1 [Olea europaea var. sylvestris]
MAFAALIYLTNTIEQNLIHHLIPDKQQIGTLLQEATFLQNFLEDSLQKDNEKVERLESQIRDVAYRATDIVESHLVDGLLSKSESLQLVESFVTFNEALEKVMEEIHSIKQEVMKVEDEIRIRDLRPRTSLGAVSSKPTLSGASTMVGLNDQFEEIRTRLITGSSKLQILSILGMGGIGKTTLAKNIYDDLSIKDHFYIRGWVTVSQEYDESKLILDILDSMKMLPDNMRLQATSDKLKGLLHKTLSHTRYLIVLDDAWDKKAWDDVKRLFSNDNNGSRIILTTRLEQVADHANSCPPLHQVRFLNNIESWKLFCDTVFGHEGCCPPELDKIGKQISQNCRGLPLSIVVIGGLLSKAIKTEHYWSDILESLHSTLTSNDEQCLKVLSLSYKHLPHHLRGCLLYMGIFPEDSNISVFELVNLWVAEGILKPIRCKRLEDVAKEYLLDLIERNLILGGKKNSMGKIKTCKIHDLLRNLCVRQSKKEMFFHPTYWYLLNKLKDITSRRVTVLPHKTKLDLEAETPSSFLPRSFLFFSWGKFPDTIESSNFRLVRVFHKYYYPACMSFAWEQLVSLRYLYFPTLDNSKVFASVYKLRHLQTLIVTHIGGEDRSIMTSKIWEMQELRHVVIKPQIFLDPPASAENARENSIIVLENLQTLTKIENFRCTEEVLKRIPNLKKLGVYHRYPLEDMNNLVRLHKLEDLTYEFHGWFFPIFNNLSFPPSLKKLTLIGCTLNREEMEIIGWLPNLQVLKIKEQIFPGSKWEFKNGGFLQLKVLLLDEVYLENWIADSIHFPELQRLVIKNCRDLKIPSGIGEIPTLQSIELFHCGNSVITSAKQIQEEQENLGNDSLQVLIIGEYKQSTSMEY